MGARSELFDEETFRAVGDDPGALKTKLIADVMIDPGKETTVNVSIEIEAKKPRLKVVSALKGVKVQIDNGKTQELPLDDESLKPGKHTLKFVGPSDRYISKEIDVSLEEGQTKSVEDVKLASKALV